jgi:hypothetical protein
MFIFKHCFTQLISIKVMPFANQGSRWQRIIAGVNNHTGRRLGNRQSSRTLHTSSQALSKSNLQNEVLSQETNTIALTIHSFRINQPHLQHNIISHHTHSNTILPTTHHTRAQPTQQQQQR